MTIGTLLVLVLLVLVLLLPYDWGYEADFLGRRAGYWRAALYTYTYDYRAAHLAFDGLRRLQIWLLLILTTVVGRLQPEMIAWLVEALRQVLGW